MNVGTLNKEKYAKVESWHKFFENGKSLYDLPYHCSWTVMFAKLKADKKFKQLNDELKQIVQTKKDIKIYPLPDYLFMAFLMTPVTELKVVFLGQDPYFKCEDYNGRSVPLGMGLSFSVADGIPIPSSENNIFANLIKKGHIKEMPKTGNLWFWAVQGCLMLNSALTVEHGKPESHSKKWEWFTDYVIQYISKYTDGIIFVLWGGHAYKKINLIDLDKHHTIISSHPSGLSANKGFRNYPAFNDEDHFGKINQILNDSNRTKIMWT